MVYVSPDQPISRRRLWVEFIGLFGIAPVLMAVVLPPSAMFPALFGITLVGLGLLAATDGFRWHELLPRKAVPVDWRFVLLFAAITAASCWVILRIDNPGAMFYLARENPTLLIAILVLYPVLSALPQELVFRVLFFRRYDAILPHRPMALWLNAGLFAFAHLMYWSWIVLALTFAGGYIFALAYLRRESFALAVLLHAIAGNLIFAIGLGLYFYSGNVVRPF